MMTQGCFGVPIGDCQRRATTLCGLCDGHYCDLCIAAHYDEHRRPPDPRSSTEPAREASSGGAGDCCTRMASAIRNYAVFPPRRFREVASPWQLNLVVPAQLPFHFCPWCGTKLEPSDT